MSELSAAQGCEFCIDAGFDFTECQVCGRGAVEDRSSIEPLTGLRLQVRLAKGGPLVGDGPDEIDAFYAALRLREARDV